MNFLLSVTKVYQLLTICYITFLSQYLYNYCNFIIIFDKLLKIREQTADTL